MLKRPNWVFFGMIINISNNMNKPIQNINKRHGHKRLWILFGLLCLLVLILAGYFLWHEAAFIFVDKSAKNDDDIVALSGGAAQSNFSINSNTSSKTISATKVEPKGNVVVVYVKPGGVGPGNGTKTFPYTSLEAARNAIRPKLGGMTGDIYVKLLDGTYKLTKPFELTSADSGRNGYRVVYEAASGAQPVLSGGTNIVGWQQSDQQKNIWTAKVPTGFNTRQLYINGTRAQVTQGPLPVTLTQTDTGYTATSSDMASWSNPQDIEFVYPSGPSNWTESRCRVATISGQTITMAQPCWDNTTKRDTPGTTLQKSNFGSPLKVYPIATNSKQLLTRPGQWYLDQTAHTISYIPLNDQDMNKVTAVTPNLQTLVEGNGTPESPIENIVFRRIEFSYAGWLEPSGSNGYSPIQTGTYMTEPEAYKYQGACDGNPQSSCPYMSFPQIPGNVSFNNAHNLTFESNKFDHLGAVGLSLGSGSQNNTIEGNLFTDTSASGLILGGVSEPLATTSSQISENKILNNYFTNTSVEYQDNAAMFVGYSKRTLVSHNQINNVPYSGIAIGWGGWQSNLPHLAPLSNYSHDNVIANNLVFDHMKTIVDGGGIYSNGIQGSSMDTSESIENNVVMQQHNPSWAIYTDNGSQFIKVTNNLVWDALYIPLAPDFIKGASPYFSFGGCGVGPITYSGNYSLQTNPAAGLLSAQPFCGGHPLDSVTVPSNNAINSLTAVPNTLISGSGIEAPYNTLLLPAPLPNGLPSSTQYPN